MNQDIAKIKTLMDDVMANRITIKEFCPNFERVWNHETNQKKVPDEQYHLLSKLFDEVVLYSPFPKEEWGYPSYRSDDDIRDVLTKVYVAISP